MPKLSSMGKSCTERRDDISNFFDTLLNDKYTTWWVDYSDKTTWFQDLELTVPALHPEDVRYIKNKAGPGYVQSERIETDSLGQHYIECTDNILFHRYLLPEEKQPPTAIELEVLEQKFMRDMGIYTEGK